MKGSNRQKQPNRRQEYYIQRGQQVHKRKYKRRSKRLSKSLMALTVMLCLLLVVSLTALGFVVVLLIDDSLSLPSVAQVTQVFATQEATPVLHSSEEELGWLGGLPEDAPEIGTPNASSDPSTTANGPTLPIPPGQEAFAVFPFYKPDHAQAYAEFQVRYPNKNAETVVWKVNALLHLPFYSYIRFNNDPNPLLVNPSHRLPYGFSPAVLVPVYENNPGLLATPATAEAFRRLRTSAIQSGLDLAVASAYRNAERQYYLFWRRGGTDGVVARPYQSEHQTGRALDLWGPGPSGLLDGGGGPLSPTGQWVRDNAHNYGFIVRYTEENRHITGFISEPWHITYVTQEIAQYIHQNNLSSLEEFVARNPGVAMR